MANLETEFAEAMRDVYVRARNECGYNATRYLQMLDEIGPFETARRLVLSNDPSDGFTSLWECGRLDLTVEAVVLRPKLTDLFHKSVRDAALSRLRASEYEPPADAPDA